MKVAPSSRNSPCLVPEACCAHEQPSRNQFFEMRNQHSSGTPNIIDIHNLNMVLPHLWGTPGCALHPSWTRPVFDPFNSYKDLYAAGRDMPVFTKSGINKYPMSTFPKQYNVILHAKIFSVLMIKYIAVHVWQDLK